MANIHIALVGGQTYPVYLGIHAESPDKVFLVHSRETKEEAERIRKEIPITMELIQVDPVDLHDIFTKTEACATSIQDTDKVSVNISGGTKPWALTFFSVFSKRKNAKIIYVDQNCRIWDFSTGESQLHAFDIDVQFRLYGNPLKEYNRFTDYTEDDKKMVHKIKQLRSLNAKEFYRLTTPFEENEQCSNESTPNGSTLRWDKNTQSFHCLLKSHNKKQTETFSSPHIRQLLLRTGWFEYEVAEMLTKWDKAKEVRMNCIFPSKQVDLKNEIDIIVDTGTKLLFVECKTNIHRPTDIDKFNSAVKNYGGMGSKSILITQSKISQTSKEKCDDYGILCFSIEQTMLGQDPSRMLYLLLNQELFNINPK